jgi:hypothetical protein
METPVAKMIHPKRNIGREAIKYREHFHLSQVQLSRTIAKRLAKESLLHCKPQKFWFESLYLECKGSINKNFSYQMGTLLIS